MSSKIASIDEAYGFVYITTNLINGKKYIGKNTTFNDDYLGSGTIISRSINKYGKENFKRKIIYIAKTKDELNLAEKLFIRSRNANRYSNKLYYNIAPGGDGGNIRQGMSDEQLKIYNKKISETSKKIAKRPEVIKARSEGTKRRNEKYGNPWTNRTKGLNRAARKVYVYDSVENKILNFDSKISCQEYFNITEKIIRGKHNACVANNNRKKSRYFKDRYLIIIETGACPTR